MESFLNNRIPVGVAFTDEDVIVTLSDGTKISNPLAWHSWIQQATFVQMVNVEFYSDSIDWLDLNEGLDIEGMLRGIRPRQPRPIAE